MMEFTILTVSTASESSANAIKIVKQVNFIIVIYFYLSDQSEIR